MKQQQDLEARLAERDRKISELEAAVVERDRRIAALEEAQAGLLWDLLCAYLRVKDRALPHGSTRRATYNLIVDGIKNAKRQAARFGARDRSWRERGYNLVRSVYRRLPLSDRQKQRLKSWVLRQVPPTHNPFPGMGWPPVLPYDGDFSRQTCQRLTGSPISVLFLSHWLPAMDRASGGLRTFTILRLLSEQGFSVAFGADREKSEHNWFYGSEGEVSRYRVMLEGIGVTVFYGFREIVGHLRKQGCQYDFVVLSFPEIAYRYTPCARAYAIHAKVIYDPVDLTWVRMEREAEIKQDEFITQQSWDYRQIDRVNIAGADIVMAITEAEKTEILKEVPNANILLIPNIHECVDAPNPLADRKGLFFIGHFLHNPNEDAVVYFVKEIFPLIRQRLPDVVFYMVGSNMTDKVQSLAGPGVVPLGYVADPSAYFQGCRVFVAPLRYGAGMKGKIGQSMSFGLPVVTTSIGSEGMSLIDGQHVLIADSPKAFAQAVVQLYTDDRLWERMSLDALAHIRAHFSKAAVGVKLVQIFARGQAAGCAQHDPLDVLAQASTPQDSAR